MLVLTPTRELAKQVHDELKYLADTHGFSTTCFHGGVSYGPQEGALRRGVDILVATVGRVIDHIDRGNLHLNDAYHVVLDEADEMLSMGFADDVERIFGECPAGADAASLEPFGIVVTRLRLPMTWVVSFCILGRFGPHRGRRGVSERTRSRRWRLRDRAASTSSTRPRETPRVACMTITQRRSSASVETRRSMIRRRSSSSSWTRSCPILGP